MGEIRKRPDGKIIKTKSRAARRAIFDKQTGKKADTPKTGTANR